MTGIPGLKACLMGAIGTGKTHCIQTALNQGLDIYAIFTEQNALSVAGPILDKISWTYIPPNPTSWKEMSQNVQTILMLDSKARAASEPSRKAFTGFLDIVNLCNNFVDQNGLSHGPIDSWNTDRLLFFDSLSGLTKMTQLALTGTRTAMSLPEYGEGQNMVARLIEQINETCRCHFILCCHVELHTDEVMGGGSKILLHTLGNKLAPVLPRTFNDCILTRREETNFFWSTLDPKADLKTNHLPLSNNLRPDIGQLLNGWLKRGGVISKTERTTK